MATITINEKTVKGKSLLNFLNQFKSENFISISMDIEKSPYNKKFLNKIKESREQINAGKIKKIKTVDLWK